MQSSHPGGTAATQPGQAMAQRIDILVTSEPDDGTAPFQHEALRVAFHRHVADQPLPLLEGEVWAFVDWVMPSGSGLELCRRLRDDLHTARARIVMVLDEDDLEARRRALRAGADDYVVGPVSRSQVLDRVLASGAGSRDAGNLHVVVLGEFSVDLVAFQARWRGTPLVLMPNEFRLLRYLIEHPGRVFSRAALIAALGKQDPPLDERTVDVWIGRLRRALRAAGAGERLRTVRSLGYVLDPL